ncbi:breast carcinoma-amplified sequence 4 [Dryobates pubescens]|uniref:breast carcinoma-amplified sequence 4 n=1 Tax=Dryobates pubescens TaxID=118200 RepID=UPI0023BA3C94|nr:breast carcinoma-amplified sequence 4 [Dryobates pubescens]
MSSAGGQLRPAAEVMLRPEEFQESRAGTTDEESWTRRLDPCPIPPPREEVGADEEGAEQGLPRPGGGPSAGERGAGSALTARRSRQGTGNRCLRVPAARSETAGGPLSPNRCSSSCRARLVRTAEAPAGSPRALLSEGVKEMEETIEELLRRLEEFCGIMDAIRSDTSEILDETIPLIKGKVMEMNHVYAKVDKLEAFVKMVAHHVSFLKEQVLEAEKSQGTFLNTVCKLFQCASASSFKKSQLPSAARSCDLPQLYRTEDYFPVNDVGTKYPNQ